MPFKNNRTFQQKYIRLIEKQLEAVIFIPPNAESFFTQFHKINKRKVVLPRPPSPNHCLFETVPYLFLSYLDLGPRVAKEKQWHNVCSQLRMPGKGNGIFYMRAFLLRFVHWNSTALKTRWNGTQIPTFIGITSLLVAVSLLQGMIEGRRDREKRKGERNEGRKKGKEKGKPTWYLF